MEYRLGYKLNKGLWEKTEKQLREYIWDFFKRLKSLRQNWMKCQTDEKKKFALNIVKVTGKGKSRTEINSQICKSRTLSGNKR